MNRISIWVKNIHQGPFPEDLVIYRFKRIAFRVISSPFLLTAIVRHHLGKEIEDMVKKGEQQKAELVQKVISRIYVDNLISGTTTCEEIMRMYAVIKNIFRKALFNMRAPAPNAPGNDKIIPAEDLENARIQKVLGMTRRLDDDKWEIFFQRDK